MKFVKYLRDIHMYTHILYTCINIHTHTHTHVHFYMCEAKFRKETAGREEGGSLLPRIEDTGIKVD